MTRLNRAGQTTLIAMAFIVLAAIVFPLAKAPGMTAIIAALGCLAMAAIAAVAWLINRRQRAAFLASLSGDQQEQLRGFELVRGWGTWRQFQELNP